MFALGAGDLFNVNGHSEYVETTIGRFISSRHHFQMLILSKQSIVSFSYYLSYLYYIPIEIYS